MVKPNYQKIYQDIIKRNFPEKIEQTKKLLKKNMNVLDIMKVSEILNANKTVENQKHKSYDLNSVLEILKFQQKNNYTNTYTADKFKISRNTVAKWRKIYEYKKTVSKRNRFFLFIYYFYPLLLLYVPPKLQTE
ncbi:helix-turn-helix domain-containing protein [Empedobacter falsenii]|uniref:helix-turn-helix domain-containing protein n=1 Tax=Empedobacter falsenii TaxID=343874 RepID=UPI003A7F8752